MRNHSKHIELKREEAIAKLIEASTFDAKHEIVNLHDALGRVTACDCTSKYDIPNALCAQMDGIAVRFDDFVNGIPDASTWSEGVEFGWANTGTAMPDGFDTAIAIERVKFDDNGRLTIHDAPRQRGACCKQPGSIFSRGQLLVSARTKLTPAKISALAMCGYTEVECIERPKVVFIPTGDELVEMGCDLPAGKAYETNGILLEMKMRLWGAQPIIYPCLPDSWDQIKEAILRASQEADIVAINAGSSKGSKDFTMEILEEIGTVFCHETNHGPGKHTSASMVNGTPVLGLSGPPSGCEITADWYLKPLIDSYLYGHTVEFTTVTAILAEPLVSGGHGGPGGPGGHNGEGGPGGPGKDFFAIRPMQIEYTPQGIQAKPIRAKGHHNLLQLDDADGYLEHNPKTFGDLDTGSVVEIELRYPYTNM